MRYCLEHTFALVVQWIERWSPKPKIWVRIPARAPLKGWGYACNEVVKVVEVAGVEPACTALSVITSTCLA